MEIDKVFGLPAHPLIVHAPLVLIPFTALALLALALKPHWRERWGLPLAIWTVVLFGLCALATGSGEKLELRVEDNQLVKDHAELGEQLRTIVMVLAIVTVGWIAAARLAVRRAALTRAILPLGIAAVVLGGVATVWDVRTGHAGAKAAWQDVGQAAPRSSSE
jgi:hypothetical protein